MPFGLVIDLKHSWHSPYPPCQNVVSLFESDTHRKKKYIIKPFNTTFITHWIYTIISLLDIFRKSSFSNYVIISYSKSHTFFIKAKKERTVTSMLKLKIQSLENLIDIKYFVFSVMNNCELRVSSPLLMLSHLSLNAEKQSDLRL